ncbi:hypothetical protein [Mesorhizobium sp. STM 4661]|uniref:hypothetical protein n=1 Tax=Mesorhizobium sp. STM 4661 TaxID=1297570 RepID=UPI001FCA5F8D|nr:hypothetical protein [Mesorhizobium sp. STM 4661]
MPDVSAPAFRSQAHRQSLAVAKALVDLTVSAFAALLDREHHQQSNADADKREKRQADKRHEHALPRDEVDVAQSVGSLPVASSPVSSPAGHRAILASKSPSGNLRQSAMIAESASHNT